MVAETFLDTNYNRSSFPASLLSMIVIVIMPIYCGSDSPILHTHLASMHFVATSMVMVAETFLDTNYNRSSFPASLLSMIVIVIMPIYCGSDSPILHTHLVCTLLLLVW